MHHALQFIATLSKTKRLINPISQKILRNTRGSHPRVISEQSKQGTQGYRTFASVFLYIFLDSLTL